MRKIGKEHHIHRMDSANPPAATIQPGERLVVEAWDALKGRAVESFGTAMTQEEAFRRANPATGPICVDGARPGDALEICIHDIRLEAIGYMDRNVRLIHVGGSNRDELMEASRAACSRSETFTRRWRMGRYSGKASRSARRSN